MNFRRYRILNASLLDVARSMNVLVTVQEPELPKKYFRPKESPFTLTSVTERVSGAVTAHDLLQYKNKVYSITLQESVTSWLCELLAEREDRKWN